MSDPPPPGNLGSEPTLLSWDRAHARPVLCEPAQPLRVLERVGFFANRAKVSALLGAPQPVDDATLLADLYESRRLAAPQFVAGTLAWILWDEHRRHLIAVQDRLGLSPLYYFERGTALWLSRSLDALLDLAGSSVHLPAIAGFLRGRALRPGETFYAGVRAVPPGGFLVATPERTSIQRYWRPGERGARFRPATAPDEELRALLAEVAAEHLVGEPTAAIALSGGLDSGSLAATLLQVAPDLRLTALCGVTPELPAADESAGIRAVVERLGCTPVAVAFDQHWPLQSEPALRPPREGPRCNFYSDLWDALFAAARQQGERLLFTGHGGDLLFAGNVSSYADLLLTGRWRRLAGELRRHRSLWGRSSWWIWRWMILGPLARSWLPLPRRRSTPPWLGPALRPLATEARWTCPDWRRLPGRRQRVELLRQRAALEEARLFDLQAAEHGIALRHPYLDHRLFDFAAALPAEQTFEAGIRKGIVRRAMAGRLPDEILSRHDKTAATALLARGLRERETAKVWRLLTDMRAADLGWVDQGRLRSAYRDYVEGRTKSTRFWPALTLEAWLRRWF